MNFFSAISRLVGAAAFAFAISGCAGGSGGNSGGGSVASLQAYETVAAPSVGVVQAPNTDDARARFKAANDRRFAAVKAAKGIKAMGKIPVYDAPAGTTFMSPEQAKADGAPVGDTMPVAFNWKNGDDEDIVLPMVEVDGKRQLSCGVVLEPDEAGQLPIYCPNDQLTTVAKVGIGVGVVTILATAAYLLL